MMMIMMFNSGFANNNYSFIIGYILYTILLSLVSVYLADGITYRWPFMYVLREKIKLFRQKPFACLGCMSFWFLLISLSILYHECQFTYINIIPALLLYFVVKIVETKIEI